MSRGNENVNEPSGDQLDSSNEQTTVQDDGLPAVDPLITFLLRHVRRWQGALAGSFNDWIQLDDLAEWPSFVAIPDD